MKVYLISIAITLLPFLWIAIPMLIEMRDWFLNEERAILIFAFIWFILTFSIAYFLSIDFYF